MEKDAEQRLAELLETVLAEAVTEGPVEPLEISTQAIAKDPALFREIRQQLIVEAVRARARSILRRSLTSGDDRQLQLFDPIPDFPDAPALIVVKRKYGSPLHFTLEDSEWFLMWAKHRLQGIAQRLKVDRKAIQDFSKMLSQAKPYLVKQPTRTIGEALDERKRYLASQKGQKRHSRAKKAREAQLARTKNQ